MTKALIARGFIASIFIIAGLIWFLMFPKTSDILRPDFVASLGIGVGLIFAGLIVFFLNKHSIIPSILSILLLWSILLNLFLLSYAKSTVKVISEMSQETSNVSKSP